MPTVELRRGLDMYGLFGRMEFIMDGQVVALLRPRARAVLSVEPGTHSLQARFNPCTSRLHELDLSSRLSVSVKASLPYRSLFTSLSEPEGAIVTWVTLIDDLGPIRTVRYGSADVGHNESKWKELSRGQSFSARCLRLAAYLGLLALLMSSAPLVFRALAALATFALAIDEVRLLRVREKLRAERRRRRNAK
jgi:hypothetical protein